MVGGVRLVLLMSSSYPRQPISELALHRTTASCEEENSRSAASWPDDSRRVHKLLEQRQEYTALAVCEGIESAGMK